MRHTTLIVGAAVGIAIVLWLIQFTGANEVLHIILGVDLLYIILATFLFITASVMVSIALFVPLKHIGQGSSLRNVIMASFGGQLLGDITPARSGYFLTPLILNKIDNTSVESSMTGVAATGAANFFAKATISSVALAYFVKYFPLNPTIANALILGVLLLIAGGLGLSIFIWGKHLNRRFERLVKMPLIGRAVRRLELLNKIRMEGQKVKGCIPYMTILIILSMVTNAIALYFISTALEHSISLLNLIFIVSIVSALMYVPITIAGLGVQETGYVVFLTLLGMPLVKATAFALIARFLFTGTDIIGLQPLLRMRFKGTSRRIDMDSGSHIGPLQVLKNSFENLKLV